MSSASAEDCPWLEIEDPTTGRKFYANRDTSERTWTMPEEFRLAYGLEEPQEPKWWELFDENNQLPYYHNIETGETLWIKPEGVEVLTLKQRAANDAAAAASDQAEEEEEDEDEDDSQDSQDDKPSKSKSKSHRKDKKKTKKHSSRRKEKKISKQSSKNHTPPPPPAAESKDDWKTLIDEQSGKEYYHNESTGVTQWEKPNVLNELNEPEQVETPVDDNDNDNNENDDSDEIAPKGEVVEHDDGVARAYTVAAAVPKSKTAVRQALADGEREEALPTSIADELSNFQLEEYAKKYFQSHKKGVFRRQIPIKDMLLWSQHPLKTPMIRIHNSSHAKEAVSMFKHVLQYMGDMQSSGKKINRSPVWHAHQAIQKACNIPELRDEAFCQLCKQTNGNPNQQSLLKGWELMVMYAYSFPPTKDFEGWFRQYLQANKRTDSVTAMFASYTIRNLNRTTRLSSQLRGRVPQMKELEVQRTAPFNPSPFGASLEECMEMQKEQLPDDQLPHILVMLCEGVLNNRGRETEGLFRVPADIPSAEKLKVEIEKGAMSVACKDPHVIGSVLKLWIRELAEPLIPDDTYDECIKAADNPKKSLKIAQTDLPPLNRAALLYICSFLRKIAEGREKTKMGIPNLAMVFAPNILRCPSPNPQTIFENTKYEVNYLQHLIRLFKN